MITAQNKSGMIGTDTGSMAPVQNTPPVTQAPQQNQNGVPEGLDPTAYYLTKAIKEQETGGSADPYNQAGKSGEHGAYQYEPDTWNTLAAKNGINVPLQQSTP